MSGISSPTPDEPEPQTPVPDEATPEQPVVQRAGTPLTDTGDGEGTDTDDMPPTPESPVI